MNWKRALLAVPPLLGLLCIWNISHRQERLLVGRWQTGATNSYGDGLHTDTISFNGDGTYEKEGWRPATDNAHPNTGSYRSLGRWYFADKNHLVMEVEGEEDGGKPIERPGICGNPEADEDPAPAPGGEISIEGDTAHVDGTLGPGGPTWTRIAS